MTLCLSKEELHEVRACWNNVQTNNKYHKDQFISRLFSNLLAANSDLRSFFKSDIVVREHSLLFNDLLNYLIIYLDNVERLNQFLLTFFKENNEVVSQINYLEPMGTALIQTFRQWLGKGIFNEKMEQLWVQIYIHLANNILIYSDDSDASSIGSESESESMEEVQGLNIVRNQQEQEVTTPATPVSPVLQQVEEEEQSDEDDYEYSAKPIELTKKPSLQINIKSNDKYRGFRRNDSNIVEIEPSLPSRSPRRSFQKESPSPSLTAKFNNLKPKIVYDSDEEQEEKGFGFDPRKSNKRRSAFSENMGDVPPPPIEKDFIPIKPVEEDDYDLNEQPTELEVTLQPIVESSDNEIDVDSEQHFNDNTSSIYNSDVSEPSSCDNTLSLHSHRSGGTEGTEPMSLQKVDLRTMDSNESRSDTSVENGRVFSNVYNSRQTSISSVEPEFMASIGAPKQFKAAVRSQTPSQTDLTLQKSIQLSQRASLGFMRSSFILKKEIDTLGFNKPENVFLKPPTIPAANSAAMNSSPSLDQKNQIRSDSSSEDEAYELLNTFMPITNVSKSKAQVMNKRYTSSCTNLNAQPISHPKLKRHTRSTSNLTLAKHNNYDALKCGETTACIRGSNATNGKEKGKRSFRDKVKALFGGAKEEPKRVISNPVETTYSTNSTVPVKSTTSMSSKSNSNFSRVSRVSSHTSVDNTRSDLEMTDKSTPMTKFEKRSSRMASVTDLTSMNTVDTNESTSGFSFFDRRRNSTSSKYSTRGDRKKNKYNVSKTPYDVFAHNKLIFSN